MAEGLDAPKLPGYLDWYRSTLTWIVALASAAIAFGASFYKEQTVAATDRSVRWFLGMAGVAYVATIFFAIWCCVWLVDAANHKENEETGRRRLQGTKPGDVQELERQVEQSHAASQQALTECRWRYQVVLWAYPIGMLSMAIAVFLGIVRTPTPVPIVAPAPPDRFEIVSSPERMSPEGRLHSHTLLLNKRNGEVWNLVCAPGNRVRFQKVEVEGRGPSAKASAP